MLGFVHPSRISSSMLDIYRALLNSVRVWWHGCNMSNFVAFRRLFFFFYLMCAIVIPPVEIIFDLQQITGQMFTGHRGDSSLDLVYGQL